MIVSDISVKRPVLATVFSLLLVTFGVVAFFRLPLREYPDISPPVVTVSTTYRGASAAIVETKITQVLEDQISGIEGLRTIQSTSEDGLSSITVEFLLQRDIDAAANDVRDRVNRATGDLPREADPPRVVKADVSASPIMWLSITDPDRDSLQLTDYADRFLVDRFSAVEGVSRVIIGGERRYAMRIWLDPRALASRDLTVRDVEEALERENVERAAGRLESLQREFTLRTVRGYRSAADFEQLVLRRGEDGHLVRLGEVARVELSAENLRTDFRRNQVPTIGLGIAQQSRANTLAVARRVKAEVEDVQPTLPEGMKLEVSYDSSLFIEASIQEVVKTMGIAALLVVLIIYLFLGEIRATLVPAVTVPISLVATFLALYVIGFSVNILTLLALVLSIGLLVDDAIVMLENIYRRIEEGEPPLLAAYRGARQVGFAVLATTVALVAVFVPISLLGGNVGRLFSEFALTMAAAVCFSTLIALTLSPVMCSWLLRPRGEQGWIEKRVDRMFAGLSSVYGRWLEWCLSVRVWMVLVLIAVLGVCGVLFYVLPSEFAPQEDRGVILVIANMPEGASFEYALSHMRSLEEMLMEFRRRGEARQVLVRVPGTFTEAEAVNSGLGILPLEYWGQRPRPAGAIAGELFGTFAGLPGVQAFPILPQGLTQSAFSRPVQFVIQGPSYEQLARWRDVVLERAANSPSLSALDSDYKETKPQMEVRMDRDRAADLGISVETVGRTLETLLGSRRLTTFLREGQEYDVVLQARDRDRQTPSDLENVYVRSARTDRLIPLHHVVTLEERGSAAQLNRFNRLRAVTISANVTPGFTLGEALGELERIAESELPPGAGIDYRGESREFRESALSLYGIFALALLVVYLVLAAQFESFLNPFVIMLTVPLGVAGALAGLYLVGMTLNIYSQIGLIMLIGLATKNGILIVEFANQLRDRGMAVRQALLEASRIRFRPILMTAISTIVGALPLVLATGAGAESRQVLGVVVFAGMASATALTLFIVPVVYDLIGDYAGSPGAVSNRLQELQQDESSPVI